jgi:uncharacterized sulfatase
LLGLAVTFLAISVEFGAFADEHRERARPNILWITAEDISPNLGCYGDPNARTPNLDQFARENVRYTQAHSIHPCCSPSRSALATGVYPTRLGTFQHRAKVVVDGEPVRPFTSVLREAGYYCFNGSKGSSSKTDYNFEVPQDAWDKIGSKNIEWRNRQPGQPFFGQLNLYATHQSQYGLRAPGAPSKALPEHRHDPALLKVPPYHPDTEGAREIWSEYHERLSLVDSQFRALLDLLQADGLLDETIIFFFGDNGMGIPGGKIWLWNEGPHVPLLVGIPPQWRLPGQAAPGTVTDQLVSFVDFAPTTLALAGVKIPDWMEGQPFLGPHPATPRSYVHAARDFHDVADFDTSRMVRDARYHYIRNFMPQIGWDAIDYSWQRAPYFLESWRHATCGGQTDPSNRQSAFFRSSKPPEELYEVAKDPFQLNNLADDPACAQDLKRLRAECRRWMLAEHDLGLLSQYELYRRSAEDSPYAMATDPKRNPTSRMLEAADLANACDPENIEELQRLMSADDCAIRRWGAIGLLSLGSNALPALATLESGLADDSPDVRMTCAEALADLGRTNEALPVLIALVTHNSGIIRCQALLALARIGPAARAALPHIEDALVGGSDRNVWSADNVPDLVQVARAAIADPDPPVTGPLPRDVPMKARRMRCLP